MSDLIGQVRGLLFYLWTFKKTLLHVEHMIGQLHVMITINYKTEIYLTRDKATAMA